MIFTDTQWREYDISEHVLQGQHTFEIVDNAKVKLFCMYTQTVHQTIHIRLKIGAHAQVEIEHIFNNSSGAYTYTIESEKDAYCRYNFLVLNGNNTVKITANSNHDRSQIDILATYILSENSVCTITTDQLHSDGYANGSTARIVGVVTNDAQLFYQGNIKIDIPAISACAHQYNKNITLSDRAKISAKPGLQVLHNNVSCSHASVTGKLEQSAITYAQSRGLSFAQAQKIIIIGILQETTMGDQLNQYMNNAVTGILHGK